MNNKYSSGYDTPSNVPTGSDKYEGILGTLSNQLDISCDDITHDMYISSDDFHRIELAIAISMHYDIMLPQDIIDNFKTVGDVLAWMSAHMDS